MSIRLENISKYYGHQVVVNNINLEIKDGEFFVLLGASGSGKTTVLNIIAGLIPPDKGHVFIHDREVTQVPTQKRNIGFVFQHYALFQYMSVADNIEFGLQVRKVSQAERAKKRDQLLELVGLVGMGNRMPSQLSGGQQQRVALARALALEPDVLLLDEPLGALDAKIRVELRRSLRRIQQTLGVAAILVTHDQDEAFDLADRIGVMNFGRLIEVGTPQELYQYPKTEYVASFLGSANLLLGQIKNQHITLGQQIFPMPKNYTLMNLNRRAQILFRPEDVALAGSPKDLDCLPLGSGKIIEKGFSGAVEHIRVELPAIPGVRAIAPAVPYGTPSFYLDVNRSPEQSTNLPFNLGGEVSVGIRRLHVLSHPGLNFLILSDGSLRSQSAIILGGYLGRMSHAQVLLLGIGADQERLDQHLMEARKQLGSGMASLEVQSSPEPFVDALAEAVERHPADLVILGWRPSAGYDIPEQAMKFGEHHLLLAAKPLARLSKALICLASGEPGKDNVIFAGRLLRHLGADATLLTVVPGTTHSEIPTSRIERFLQGGQKSLARFGVSSEIHIRKGELIPSIQAEIADGGYDLIVLGAPLPNSLQEFRFKGVIGSIISSIEECSFLIIRSQQYQKLQTRQWRLK